MGRHGKRKTDAQPGDAGRYEELTPEQKGKAFDGLFGRSKIRSTDAKLAGRAPYENEPTTKKKRWGRS